MEKFIFSAIAMIIMVVGTVGAKQNCCADSVLIRSQPFTVTTATTMCELARQVCEDCKFFAEAVKKYQRINVDVNSNLKGLTLRMPTAAELSAVKGVTVATVTAVKTGVKKTLSRQWITKRVSSEMQAKYFMLKYTLVAGDDIYTVAKDYDFNPQTIAWFNPGMTDPENLKVGQVIAIPSINYFYWLIQGGAPYGSRPADAALYSFSFADSIKDYFSKIVAAGKGESGYIRNGQVLNQMVSAPVSSRDQKIRLDDSVVSVFDKGEAYQAMLYRDTVGNFIMSLADPKTCHNWCWWVEPYTPPLVITRQTVIDSTPKKIVEETPDDTETGWPTTKAETTDTPIVVKTETAPNNLTHRNELCLWVGHYCPYPVLRDGHNYYGGRYNHFFGSANSPTSFGINLGVNGWDGYGPKPEWSRYVGFCPAGGVDLDVVSGRSRVTFFADYAFQYEHGWNDSDYVWTQPSQFFYPGLTFAVNGRKKCHWVEGWLDGKWDVSHEKWATYQGEGVKAEPGDKSSVFFGARYYFIDISVKKTPMALGLTLKTMHLFEDHRFEIGFGPSWSINYFLKLGVEAKQTFNSNVKKQNGPSGAVTLDVDVLNLFR